MHFHHRNPADKSTEVSKLIRRATIDQLKREIDKCEVLCANCHAKHHWGDIYWGVVDNNQAAVRHHGALIGGLLEHTVNVATIAELISHLYPCNHDMVVAGALLHDIGKLEEMTEQVGGGFTVNGRMVGHIILAHHTKEYASPVHPSTIEALIVHQADLAEAQFTGFLEHCQRSFGADGWTSFSAIYGGQLRLP